MWLNDVVPNASAITHARARCVACASSWSLSVTQMMHAESEGRTKQAAASSVSPPVCDPQMLVGPLLF